MRCFPLHAAKNGRKKPDRPGGSVGSIYEPAYRCTVDNEETNDILVECKGIYGFLWLFFLPAEQFSEELQYGQVGHLRRPYPAAFHAKDGLEERYHVCKCKDDPNGKCR